MNNRFWNKGSDTKIFLGSFLWNFVLFWVFVTISLILRSSFMSLTGPLNPDEAEFIAQARAAISSPIPFTTWSLTTAGPVTVYLLVILSYLGLPLNIVSAHFVAALLVGVIGYLVSVALSRSFGKPIGILLAFVLWLPLVLVSPLGDAQNFATLSTELLPLILVFAAYNLRPSKSPKHNWLYFMFSGLLLSLAFLAKFQVLPIVLVIVLYQFFLFKVSKKRTYNFILYLAVGALIPFFFLFLGFLTSTNFSIPVFKQYLKFMSAYSEDLNFGLRISASTDLLLSQPPLLVLALVAIFVGYFSSKSSNIFRLSFFLSGIFSVYFGGMGFPHYLLFAYCAAIFSIAIPMNPSAIYSLKETVRAKKFIIGSLMLVLIMFSTKSLYNVQISTPKDIIDAGNSVTVSESDPMQALCPPGSNVTVWGWASELYAFYKWENAFPFVNVFQLTWSQVNNDLAGPILFDSLEQSDCVIDAVGKPFFHYQPQDSLRNEFPEVTEYLDHNFRIIPGLIDCESCSVYVRN